MPAFAPATPKANARKRNAATSGRLEKRAVKHHISINPTSLRAPMPTLTYGSSSTLEEPSRPRWQSFKRGLSGRCPACGEGHIFRKYLKVADSCACCGEELHHHRADDAPPYFTILIVG